MSTHFSEKTEKKIIGIDPGGRGAIAILAYYMEASRFEIRSTQPLTAETLMDAAIDGEIYVEQLKPLPFDTPKTAWVLGKSVGLIDGIIAGRRLTATYLRPDEWQTLAWRGISRKLSTAQRTGIAFHALFPNAVNTPKYAQAAALIGACGFLREKNK